MAGKPSPDQVRDCRIVIYMTPNDAQFLTDLANDLGIKSRSSLMVSVFERLIEGGFSPLVFLQVSLQLAKLTPKRGKLRKQDFYLGKPKPLLPDFVPGELTAKQRKAIENLEKAFN